MEGQPVQLRFLHFDPNFPTTRIFSDKLSPKFRAGDNFSPAPPATAQLVIK